ncbi:MAG: hypothetical protein AAFR93_06135, partial [Pseudomonadota bacterium]
MIVFRSIGQTARHIVLTVAVFCMVAAMGVLLPLTAGAQSNQVTKLETLTVEQVRRLREQVLETRAALVAARGAASDQRSKTDVERALHPETDLFFEVQARAKAQGLRKACVAQDWSACTTLGAMYEDGEGTWKDEHLAFAFYVTACFARDPDACVKTSWNWRIDAASGRYEGHAPYFEVITEACENDHADSCNRLATALRLGQGPFAVDTAHADRILERACRLKSKLACSRAPKTPAERAAAYSDQCASGEPLSCFLLGQKHIVGDGIERDIARGEALIRESCDRGETQACIWVIQKDKLDTSMQADLLARGCMTRPGRICNDAARLLESLPATDANIARLDHVHELGCGAPQAYCFRRFWVQVDRAANALDPFDPVADQDFSDDVRPKAAQLRRDCSDGAPNACHQLARLYALEATPQRSLLGAYVLRPSCDAGDGAACLFIAQMRQVSPHKQVARRLYQQACDAGMREGCLRLTVGDVERAPDERLALVQDACSNGEVIACRLQAELLTQDAGRFEGEREDRARAQALFLFACGRDDTEACFRYGGALAQQARRSSAEKDLIDTAHSFLRRACAADHAQACFWLGGDYEFEAYRLSDRSNRLSEMTRFYGRACALDPQYCDSLARVTLVRDRELLRAEHGVLVSALMAHDTDFKADYRARVRRYRRDCQAGDMD